jgi:hypothetical protein
MFLVADADKKSHEEENKEYRGRAREKVTDHGADFDNRNKVFQQDTDNSPRTLQMRFIPPSSFRLLSFITV